jgi:asparagine synthase (glutamine-hydrolysing)
VVDRYQRVRMLYDEDAKVAMYTPETMQRLVAPESSPQYLSRHVHPAEMDGVAQLTRLELQHYMAHTLLRDTDAMSMANSLEVRVPLIDHELVEFAAGIPVEMKLRNGRTKAIFAEAMRDLLPKQVLNRPKRGFEMPVAAWMRGPLRDVMDDVFSAESIDRRGLFGAEPLRAVYNDFRAGNGPYMRAWALVTLELWLRQTMDEAVRV